MVVGAKVEDERDEDVVDDDFDHESRLGCPRLQLRPGLAPGCGPAPRPPPPSHTPVPGTLIDLPHPSPFFLLHTCLHHLNR